MGTRARTPYLIGREQPLRVLFAALERTPDSGEALALIAGEAGIGKSRLIDEFARRADDATVVRGGCVEGVAYAPWIDALWYLLESTDLAQLRGTVRAQLARLAPQIATADLTEQPDETDNDSEDGQHLLFEAVIELLNHVSKSTQLVLVLDDIHWIDPASSELLRYVAANLRRTPILLVAAYRPEDSTEQHDLISQLGRLGAHRIALEPLPHDAVAEMTSYLLGDASTSTDVERIARDAEGNPLFVEELVAAREGERIPETMRDLMLVRFNSLDDNARHLVRTAALIGLRTPRAWLIGATGFDNDNARAAARQAVDAGVLLADDDGRGYAFRHALLRQAVLDGLLPDDRIDLHHSIANALEQHPERAVGIDRITELARHWDAADDPTPALRWMVAAAQQAENRYAFEAAMDAYERALFWWQAVPDAAEHAGMDHIALLLAAADAAGYAGHIERAADLGRGSLDESSTLGPQRSVETVGRVYPLMWTADRAPELFEFATATVLPDIDKVEAHARARFLVSMVEHLQRHSIPADAKESALRMMDAVEGLDDAALVARAHATMAQCYELAGEFDEADQEFETAIRIARDGNATFEHALSVYNRAAMNTSIPNFERSLELLDEVDILVEKYALRRYLLPARCLRALAECLRGELTNATAALDSIEELSAEGYDAWFKANMRGLSLLFGGDYDGTLNTIDPDVVGTTEPPDLEMVLQVATLRSEALASKGDFDGARKAVDVGVDAASNFFETYWHGQLAIIGIRIEAEAAAAATAANDLGAIERAQARADRIAANWRHAMGGLFKMTPQVAALALGVEAELARLRGDDVSRHARAAAEAFEASDIAYYAVCFRLREAHALLAAGETKAATTVLQKRRGVARDRAFAGLDDAITSLARQHQLKLGPGRTTVDGDDALSARELEVLHLIVDGKSNPEIADALFITRRTAAAHVSNLLRKMGVTSRTEAVSDAHRRGLV